MLVFRIALDYINIQSCFYSKQKFMVFFSFFNQLFLLLGSQLFDLFNKIKRFHRKYCVVKLRPQQVRLLLLVQHQLPCLWTSLVFSVILSTTMNLQLAFSLVFLFASKLHSPPGVFHLFQTPLDGNINFRKNINFAYLLLLFFHGEFFLLNHFELITEIEFGGLLLQFSEFVLVFRHLFQRWFHAVGEENRQT